MFHIRSSKLRWALVFVLLSLGMLGSAAAQDEAQIEPNAGSWTTWVLESGSQFRLDAPPDDAATAAEIAELQDMAGERDEDALQQIAYWNGGAPSYHWNQIMVNTMLERGVAGNMAIRDLALFQAAIYDATVAAWDSKYTYNRLRPSEVDPSLETVIPNPASPSYPSEYAATAGAASAILAWLFPEEADTFQTMAEEAAHSRLLAGVEFPSDVDAGMALGQQVAELVIARGMADGSDAVWEGTVPTEAGHWTGENPVYPMAGTWQTWVLTSPDQFRPAPPPAYDSDEMAAEMAEVRDYERTPISNSFATFWEYGAGGRRIFWYWNDVASRLILESGWSDNAPQAARAYTLMNVAMNDAAVACWDAKYTYWSMRPFQIDPEFTPLFTTPNHPGYPSAHSCISSAAANVLAYLFPADAEEVLDMAEQATEARIWGGIHFRSDIVAGVQVGEDVAQAVVEHAQNDGDM